MIDIESRSRRCRAGVAPKLRAAQGFVSCPTSVGPLRASLCVGGYGADRCLFAIAACFFESGLELCLPAGARG